MPVKQECKGAFAQKTGQMVQTHQKRSTDTERICQNLMAWADITALCLELRKSFLKAKYGIEDDEELTRIVFAEAIVNKERKWKSMTP
jgi:hypothetical protein